MMATPYLDIATVNWQAEITNVLPELKAAEDVFPAGGLFLSNRRTKRIKRKAGLCLSEVFKRLGP
jgi:hypothetical protein